MKMVCTIFQDNKHDSGDVRMGLCYKEKVPACRILEINNFAITCSYFALAGIWVYFSVHTISLHAKYKPFMLGFNKLHPVLQN